MRDGLVYRIELAIEIAKHKQEITVVVPPFSSPNKMMQFMMFTKVTCMVFLN